jgi:hypothetical protein
MNPLFFRVSTGLFDIMKHSWTPIYGCGLPLTVTVGHFCGVLYFKVDPLCEVDVVLGGDWVQMFLSEGVCSGIDSLPVYRLSVCLFGYHVSTNSLLSPSVVSFAAPWPVVPSSRYVNSLGLFSSF